MELNILSMGLAALMAGSFIWLSFKDQRTAMPLRISLLQMGLLFLVNMFAFMGSVLAGMAATLSLTEGMEQSVRSSVLMLHYLTMFQIGALLFIFPSPVFVTRRANGLVIGAIVVFGAVMIAAAALTDIWFQFAWILAGLVMTGVLILIPTRWYLLHRTSDDPIMRNHAIAAALLVLALLGGISSRWPMLFFAGGFELFYQGELAALKGMSTELFVLAHWNNLFPILALLLFLGREISLPSDRRDPVLLLTSLAFFVFGFVNLLVVRFSSSDGEFGSLWDFFAINGMFGLIRPLMMIYIAFRFNLFDMTDPAIRKPVRIIALLLVTVWTSSLFEILQAFMPLPQLLSAALIGVMLAFAIGWEERIFDRLASGGEERRLSTPEGIFVEEDGFRLTMATLVMVVLSIATGVMLGGVI